MNPYPLLLAAGEQLPEDVGKSGPFGLTLTLVLLVAAVLLVRSMTTHLKRLPRSFDPAEQGPRIPDTPAELMGEGGDLRDEPGQELLDTLRRAPRAIEPPRNGVGDAPDRER